MKKELVYISGPISGLEREEYLARFAEAERWLRNRGYRVLNPCRLAPCRWLWLYHIIGYKLTLWYDLFHLLRCDRIAFLPGWSDSCGAAIENHWAGRWNIPDIIERQALYEHIKTFIKENYGEENKEI